MTNADQPVHDIIAQEEEQHQQYLAECQADYEQTMIEIHRQHAIDSIEEMEFFIAEKRDDLPF